MSILLQRRASSFSSIAGLHRCRSSVQALEAGQVSQCCGRPETVEQARTHKIEYAFNCSTAPGAPQLDADTRGPGPARNAPLWQLIGVRLGDTRYVSTSGWRAAGARRAIVHFKRRAVGNAGTV